ncbi:MAG: hypothetical protein AABW90_02860 [Nanoarchaeota archaeon]
MSKTKNLEGVFVIALPAFMSVREYESIKKRGGSVATTTAGAIGNYLHIVTPGLAKIIMANLRDNGGYDKYAMKIPENYIYENREKVL